MIRLLLLLILLLLPAVGSADKTEDQLKAFLESRTIIDRVYFSLASHSLGDEARDTLDKVAVRLRKLISEGYLLRVEGFASPEGAKAHNVNLSMYRALAVRDYLKSEYSLNLDLYLTGYGEYSDKTRPVAGRRVDIAAYQQPKAAMALFDDQGTVEKIRVR